MEVEVDLSVVDNILSMVLPLNPVKPYRIKKRKKSKLEFNPDSQVIVAKEDLNIINEVKVLAGMVKEIHSIYEYVEKSKSRVEVSTEKPKSKAKISTIEKQQAVTAKLLKKTKGVF